MTVGATTQNTAPSTNSGHRTAVLLDQYPLWLDALEQVLAKVGVGVVGKTTRPEVALALISDREPDIFVTSIETSGSPMDGLECLRRAHERVPELKAIVVSMFDTPQYVDAAIEAGANAYVVKTAQPEDIASAIKQALEHAVPARNHQPQSRRPKLKAIRGGADLTPREFEILQLVAEGNTNAEIAKRLWVTQWTVKFHLANAYRKLGVSNRTEAARYMFEHGLVALTSAKGA
jgi:DNA-binding NarL/FixJ family response regulator